MVYTTALLLVLNYQEEPAASEYAFRESLTWAVLYGIFPAVLLGMLISYCVYKWRCKPLQLFERAVEAAARGELHMESAGALKKVYRCAAGAMTARMGLGQFATWALAAACHVINPSAVPGVIK